MIFGKKETFGIEFEFYPDPYDDQYTAVGNDGSYGRWSIWIDGKNAMRHASYLKFNPDTQSYDIAPDVQEIHNTGAFVHMADYAEWFIDYWACHMEYDPEFLAHVQSLENKLDQQSVQELSDEEFEQWQEVVDWKHVCKVWMAAGGDILPDLNIQAVEKDGKILVEVKTEARRHKEEFAKQIEYLESAKVLLDPKEYDTTVRLFLNFFLNHPSVNSKPWQPKLLEKFNQEQAYLDQK